MSDPLKKASKNVRAHTVGLSPEQASARIHQYLKNKGFQVEQSSREKRGPGFSIEDGKPYVRETTTQPAAHEAGHMLMTPPGEKMATYQRALNAADDWTIDDPKNPKSGKWGSYEEYAANAIEHGIMRRAGVSPAAVRHQSGPLKGTLNPESGTIQSRKLSPEYKGRPASYASFHNQHVAPQIPRGQERLNAFEEGRHVPQADGTLGQGAGIDAKINARATMKKNANGTVSWAGRPIVDPSHVTDLETQAALHEFRDRLPRKEAEEKAHTSYRRDHHLTGAAHHLNGMRAAQSAGQMEEAQKHGAMYAMHLKAIGEDPYGEPPAEINQRAQAPDREKLYRFKPHQSDTFVLQDPPEMKKGEVIEFDRLAKSESQTTQQEPNMDKKTELSQNLRKFWDEKHATMEKAEKINDGMNTLYKAAKIGLDVLSKANDADLDDPKTKEIRDRESAFDQRAEKPHKYKAAGGGTKGSESCSHCGESVGHKSHYDAGGFHDQKKNEYCDPVTKAERKIAGEKHTAFEMKKSEAKKKAEDFWKKREGQKFDEPAFEYEK